MASPQGASVSPPVKWDNNSTSPECGFSTGRTAWHQPLLESCPGGAPSLPSPPKAYLEELGCLLLELLHLPLVLAGVERGGWRRAGAAAVGPRAHRLHSVVVLHPGLPAAHSAASVLAQWPHDALAAAVGALRGHPHLVHVTKHLQEGLR